MDAAGPPLDLAGDDVVVFLGGTDMVRAQRSGHLETLLTWRFKNDPPRFRDLSWEADTVFALGTETDRWRGGGYRGIKGLGNLEKQLARLKATVVIVQLGKNEAFAGGEGIESFIEASDKLFSRLSGDGLELIVISPTPFEKAANDLLPDLRNHNDDLARCVNALSSQAKKHKAHFVDLFTDAEATFTGNGQHVTAGNQARFALHLAAALGVERSNGFAGLEDFPGQGEGQGDRHQLHEQPAADEFFLGDVCRRQRRQTGAERHILDPRQLMGAGLAQLRAVGAGQHQHGLPHAEPPVAVPSEFGYLEVPR